MQSMRRAAGRTSLSSCVAMIGAVTLAEAAPDSQSPDATVLQEVIVTSTRSAKPVDETPGASFVVNKQDMEKRNLQTLDDSLNLIPGVFQKRAKGLLDVTNYLVLRGVPNTNYNRTVIMLDGMAINDAYTNGATMGGFAPEDLERVEVALGPASSLYGSSAMGGVINYVTHKPTAAEFRFSAGLGGGLGSDLAGRNLKKAFLSLGNAWENGLTLAASAASTTTDGYASNPVVSGTAPPSSITGAIPTTTTSGAPAYILGDQGNNGWRDNYFALRADLRVSSETSLNAGYTRTAYHYGYGNPSTGLRDATGNPAWAFGAVTPANFLGGLGEKAQDIYRVGLDTSIGQSRLKLTAGMLNVGTNWYVSVPSGSSTATLTGGAAARAYSQTPSRSSQLDANVTTPLFGSHLLVWGASWNRQTADTSTYDLGNWAVPSSLAAMTDKSGGRITTTGLYAQAEIQAEPFRIYPGLRYDTWRASDGYSVKVGGFSTDFEGKSASALSPKLGATWAVSPNVLLRASVGKAFRAPSVYELYRTWRSSAGTTYASNAALNPETMTGFDFGGDFRPWPGASFKATFYHNEFRDMIYRQTVTNASDALTVCGQALNASKTNCQVWVNAGRARSNGVELSLRQRLTANWALFAGLATNDSEIQENAASPSSVGKTFVQVPSTTATLGADWQSAAWSANATARHVSKRYGSDANTDTVSGVPGAYDPYTLVDVKVGYRIGRNLKASVAIDNLFNRAYYAYYRAPGRSWFISLSGDY